MENNKATRGNKRKTDFVIVDNYMIESNVMTDGEFKLYLLLLKYADSDNQCFPSLKTLGMKIGKSKRQIQNLIQGLVQKGFLKVENRKTGSGDYTSNLYTIWTDKKLFYPETKNGLISATDQSTEISPPINTIFTIDNTTSNPQSQYVNTFTREMVNEIYDYYLLINDYKDQKDLIDGILELILEVLNSQTKDIRINKEDKPIELVKSRYLKLNYMHIKYVIDEVSKQTTEIKNKRAYLLTSLYNSYTTIDVHYANLINKN